MEACEAIPGWFKPPEGFMAITKCYGAIEVKDFRVVTPGWESANMTLVKAAWMPRKCLYVNKKVWPVLKASFEACLALDDGYKIKSLACFSPRPKRVNGDLSLHSWGVAIDLNSDDNPMSSDGVLRKDIPDAWIAAFEERGFTWGGKFSKPDAMHFQFASGY